MTETPPAQPNDPQSGRPGQNGQPHGHGRPGPGQPGPGYGQQPGYQAQPVQPMRPEDEKLWATLIHLGGIIFAFVPALVGYLVLKDRGPFIREHTRSALNFQITMAIVYVISAILAVIVIGGVLALVAGVLVIIFSIIAAVAANKGQWYKYPLTFEFVK
ncbi:DUF4870 domain-containing protein [Frigoribacterium sp. PhB24]|uniref:DUF4870 domain-containing protein n=1 Tax=Frigoribacterium sp. PhB24 TaxID=2485204 RepID=UPI000FAFF008|nr:DUF4870 domain-containing protein [Frigoribacterium sp. PhB24]ROS54556.1 hypothetical protein EDF50_0646 [Frigoribacterium sp. PhB24]